MKLEIVDARRVVDVVVSSTAIVLLTVPYLFSVTAFRLVSRRPVFFEQTRYGLNGRPFTIYKLRTMKDIRDAEGNLLSDKQRTTRITKIVRRFGLDEIPQFINIFCGDMSLIGPRPQYYQADLPRWSERYQIRPGLVGLAKSVEKTKGVEQTPEEQLRYDLIYIKKRQSGHCLRLDIGILWKSALSTLMAKNDPSDQKNPRKNLRMIFNPRAPR